MGYTCQHARVNALWRRKVGMSGRRRLAEGIKNLWRTAEGCSATRTTRELFGGSGAMGSHYPTGVLPRQTANALLAMNASRASAFSRPPTRSRSNEPLASPHSRTASETCSSASGA
jgi:hypothetical protein